MDAGRAPRVPGVGPRSFDEPAAFLEPFQDATDHRGRASPALVAEQDEELVLAPAWGEAAQLQNSVLQFLRPGWPADILGPVTTVLQTARPVLPEAPKPAVEGVAGDAEVTAGQGRVPAVLVVPLHHPQPVLGLL